MNSNFIQKINNNKTQQKKSNCVEYNPTKMRALDHRNGQKYYQEKEVKKRTPSNKKLYQNAHKLNEIMAKLRKDVSFVVNYGENANEEDAVLKRLDLLKSYVDQVMHIQDIVRKGGTTFLESLFMRQKNINDILNKIRGDVFQAYLKLHTEEKYAIARRGGQMTCIFTLLGIIERELQTTYDKITQSIVKRNNLRHKTSNQTIKQIFASSRSLPVLRTLKHRSKENQMLYPPNGIKQNIKLCNQHFSEPDHIPPIKNTANEKHEEPTRDFKHFDSNIPFHNIHVNEKAHQPVAYNNKCELEKFNGVIYFNSQASIGTCENVDSNSKIELTDCKAKGFEVSLADDNIHIKIPTNVIYLAQSNNKIEVKNNISKNTLESAMSHTALSCVSSESMISIPELKTESEDSSSLYTDVLTDPDIVEESIKINKSTSNQVRKQKHYKIYNCDKCYPFISENNYTNSPSKYGKKTKIMSSGIDNNIMKNELIECPTKSSTISSQWKQANRKMTCQYARFYRFRKNRLPYYLHGGRMIRQSVIVIWVNNQKDDLFSSTSLDLSKRSDWWPAFGRSIGAPMGSVQPNTIVYKPTHDFKTLEGRLEKILRNAIMKLRPTYRTIWNRYCSSSLKKLLPSLEKAAWSGENNSAPDHLQELQHILASYKMSGFPINMPYTCPSELVDAVKSTGVHINDAPEIEFSVAVYIHPFPNNIVSVWVYVASLIRRR